MPYCFVRGLCPQRVCLHGADAVSDGASVNGPWLEPYPVETGKHSKSGVRLLSRISQHTPSERPSSLPKLRAKPPRGSVGTTGTHGHQPCWACWRRGEAQTADQESACYKVPSCTHIAWETLPGVAQTGTCWGAGLRSHTFVSTPSLVKLLLHKHSVERGSSPCHSWGSLERP